MKEATRFKYLFWFCVSVFLLSFSGMMFLLIYPIPEANREMASNTQGFLQGSLMMSAIGFLLTGNINSAMGKKPAANGEGTTTAEFTASVTTEPIKEPKEKDNGPE